jgi:hypothetical protein
MCHLSPRTGLFTAVALTGGSGAGNHEATVAAGLLVDEGEKLTMSHAPSC